MRDGKEINGNRKVEQGVKNEGKAESEKHSRCEKRRSAEKIMGEISRRSARSVGKCREKQGKSEFRG